MAETSISVAHDQFICSICLDQLKDPATIPCGHSFCMSCIKQCWDQKDRIAYSCPQCREYFDSKPVLSKNTMLTEVVESVRISKLQASRSAHCDAESVSCDVCTRRKRKSVKSCLVCLESYCRKHFEQHEEFHSRKRHKTTDATGRLEEMICPEHGKLLEMYCQTDDRCICMLCVVGEHKTHETASLVVARTARQICLQKYQKTFQQHIQKRRNFLKKLKEDHRHSAQSAVEDSERVFTELIRSIKKSRSEVTQLIRDQENAAVSQTEDLLKQLEQIEDVKMSTDAELEQLSHTDDHIHFLQSANSLPDFYGYRETLHTIRPYRTFDIAENSVSQLKEKLEKVLEEEQKKVSITVDHTGIIPVLNFADRNKFVSCYRKFTLDSNTANESLCLHDGNTLVTSTETPQNFVDHPDRFDHYSQVLCRESVSGRCYWEVEWSGELEISVSYKSIRRKGDSKRCKFGSNKRSWSLHCSSNLFSVSYNNKKTELPKVRICSRIGVFVDYIGGFLCFFNRTKTSFLGPRIHRVNTKFTEPVYPAFCLFNGSKAKLCCRNELAGPF